MARDFVEEIIAKRTARNPDFPKMVKEAMAKLDREHPAPPSEPGAQERVGSLLSSSARRIVGQARELADRRKHKTPA